MAAPIPIERAFALILSGTPSAPMARLPLKEALGCYLDGDVRADRDLPPFDRSSVDGYAVFSSDTRSAPDVLEVIEEVAAGTAPTRALAPGQAIRIMTGAPLPAGADAVVMQERTDVPKPGFVRIQMTMRSGQNVSRRAIDAHAGEVVLKSGTRIGPAEIGILATVGCDPVIARKRPRIAVLGTGDELVEPHETPGPAQIRNSNSYQLLAQCAAHGLDAHYLGIARDNREETRRLVEQGLAFDFLISTGGVSVGAHDHVGAAFSELGVDIVFNKVAIKPGKPATFGRRGETFVFGLPGNPVAALVCFHLFVMTAIRQRMGAAEPLPRWLSLPLLADVAGIDDDRTTFRPCKLAVKDGSTWVNSVTWHGSGHLSALAGCDGLFVQMPGEMLKAGERVTFYPF